jgi:hypothetical protein
MSQPLTLLSDGSLVRGGRPLESEVLMHLGDQIVLEEDATLRSYFRLFERHPLLERLNAFFPACLEEYRAGPGEGCRTHAFDRLEFGKTVEMIGFPGKPRLEIYHSLYGAVGTEKVEIRQIPLEELLDMPLGLGRLKHIVFGDRVDVLEFDTVFTLFEFIEGIVWELGFQGTLMACELRR